MERRTRFNVNSNPPPNLSGVVGELGKAFRKKGGAVSNRSQLKGLFDRAHGDYERAGVADEAMRFLLNEGVLVSHGGRTYMDKARARAVVRAVEKGDSLAELKERKDMGAYVRRLRASFRKRPAKPASVAAVAPPRTTLLRPVAADKERTMTANLPTRAQLENMASDDLRGHREALAALVAEIDDILARREERARELEEQLAALDAQRAELEEKLSALK